ncbi:MAG TPA: VOC family protein [Steroidobacteraceae bacterium]|jgi:predicted enzyme related to lactoylglutathione lyase
MHKSRLGGFIIDCQTDDLDAAARFWGAALGAETESAADAKEALYRTLRTAPGEPHVQVQQVRHESRVHLDIEADDVAAEVGRLEQLGARRIAAVADWVVMQAPTGQRFCVVRVQRADFAAKANTWRP